MYTFIARYRDPNGRWSRKPVKAATVAEAIAKAEARWGNCAGVTLHHV